MLADVVDLYADKTVDVRAQMLVQVLLGPTVPNVQGWRVSSTRAVRRSRGIIVTATLPERIRTSYPEQWAFKLRPHPGCVGWDGRTCSFSSRRAARQDGRKIPYSAPNRRQSCASIVRSLPPGWRAK